MRRGDLTARAQTLADGTLKLTSIQLEDAGEYVCTAAVGKFEFTVGKMNLTLGGKADFLSESYTLTHVLVRRFSFASLQSKDTRNREFDIP